MRRALGKGLSQLIAEQYDSSLSEISVDDICSNPEQPRTHFDVEALDELANSIRQFGLLQPLVVRPISEGKFELIAGERRWRASKLAGLQTVPIVQRAAGDQHALELALVENLQREDISSLETAVAYRRLIDQFGLTQEAVAEKVGKSRTSVANTVRLLKLPPRIQMAIQSGQLSEGHARALLTFEGEPAQLAVFDQIIEKGLTVRDVEALGKPSVKKVRSKAEAPNPSVVVDQLKVIEDSMKRFLQTQVKIESLRQGGRLLIEFYSEDDLQRILDLLGIPV